MAILDKPLNEITAEDVDLLCEEQMQEGPQFEVKQEVTIRDGKPSEQGRNAITKEIIAFANTYGGTLVVGVTESADSPHRAEHIHPVPECADLARRLRQAVQAIIDPPLQTLEAKGVVTDKDGTSGVVVMRVGKSRRAPHRSTVNKEVYVRREDESVPIDMREIRELAMSRLAEVHAIEDEISRRQNACGKSFAEFAHPNAYALQYVAISTVEVDLGRVVRRPELYSKETTVELSQGEAVEAATWTRGEFHNWRPALRSVNAIEKSEGRETHFSLTTGGVLECRAYAGRSEPIAIHPNNVVSSMGLMLNWIDRVRRAGGFPDQEYIVAPMVLVRGNVSLAPFGRYSHGRQCEVPNGNHVFPVYAALDRDEFADIITQFNDDFWNFAGEAFDGTIHFRLLEW